MKINAAARSALRKAISSHDGWDALRKSENLSLADVSRDEILGICDRLRIDAFEIVNSVPDAANDTAPTGRQSAAAAFDDVATRAFAAVAKAIEPDQAPRTARTVNRAVSDMAMDITKPNLKPWSDDKIRRFDTVLKLVDDDASFSEFYHGAQKLMTAAFEYHAKWQDALDNAANAAPKPLSEKAASTGFIPPSWSREFEDFISIHATVAVVGPAGNGKTTASRKLLEAAGYTVYEFDCTDATMPHDIVGRTALEQDNGATVTAWKAGPLAKAFADAKGALLLNEYDALDPRTGMALQSALEAGSTRRATAPDSGEQITSAGPCPIVLTMNTIGHGASVQYQGRNALDGANRDRIEIVSTGYEHEREIMVAHGAAPETAQRLADWAGKARAALVSMDSMEILSNRRLLTAAQLIDGRDKSLREATDLAFTRRLDEFNRKQFATRM